MSRTRAADHEDKRRAILAAAAATFAARGYDATSVAEVARACGVSKALLYHYHASKEALLAAVLEAHLEALVAAVASADDPALPPRARLEALAVALLEAYRGADDEHRLQVAQMPRLPPDRQERLKEMERDLVRRVADALEAARPGLRDARLLAPVAMSLFGMLNWHYLWHRPDGPLSRAGYARLAVRLVLDGSAALPAPAATPCRSRGGRAA